MINRRFIKINSIVTLIAFVLSLFASSIPAVQAAEGDVINASAVSGVWNVKTPKGEFQTQATGGYEKWADGKQRFVLRDTLGHLVSWGEAKIEKIAGKDFQVSVKDSAGTFETTKMLNTPETATEVASSQAAAPSEAAPVATKMTLGQKLSALKTKVTTPVAGGGKGSESWDKGYNFGKDTPGNIVSKIKGIFHRNQASTPAAAPAAPSAGTASAAPEVAPKPSAPAATEAAQAPAAAPAADAPKATLGQKLSALKTKVTTPVEGGGKGSEAWEKGYSFGKDTPGKVVNKVTGIFKKDSSAAPAASANTASAPEVAPKPASAPAAPSAGTASAPEVAAAPSATETAQAPAAAPKATLGEKLSALKTKVTTPVEGGGKGSEAWEKGYSFGKDTPGKVVNKVTGIFKKDSSAAPATSANTASAPEVAAKPDASAPAAKPASAETAAAPAADAPKATLGQKLSALKEKVTTPVEGGGKGSEAWEKGYKFGKETPEKAVNKVKGIFKKDDAAAAPAENQAASKDQAASKEQTPSQKLSDTKNSKVEFNEETGQFEKAPVVPKAPSKLSTALGAGKDSLKSSFSVRNIAMSAGLTVGFKIFEQIKNGEKVSIGKAVGYLATGEFAGSFVGSSLGSAAGSVVGSLVGSTIPVVGPILGAFMPAIFGAFGGSIGAKMGNDLSAGQMPSFRKAIASIDKVAVLGQAVGSTVGAAIGSMLLPGIGSIVGGIVGGMIGNLIVNKLRGRAASNVSAVNVATHQVIFNEQLAPPPVYSTPAASSAVSGGSASSDLYGSMVASYKLYSQLLAEGKGETAEAQQALAQYKQLYTQYASAMQK